MVRQRGSLNPFGSGSLSPATRAAVVLLLALVVLIAHPWPARGAEPRATVDFARDVYPILRKACLECHGPSKHRAGLHLDSVSAIRKGSKDGPVLRPGQADQSEVYRRVMLPRGDKEIMPPRGEPLGREFRNFGEFRGQLM